MSVVYCLQALVALDSALHHVDSRGLAACWDYVTMPLNMMLDSYARSRTKAPANGPPSAAASTRATDDSDIPVPAIKSDRVAEALLSECTDSKNTVQQRWNLYAHI